MKIIENSDIFNNEIGLSDLLLVTTNNVIINDSLVMGKGNALESLTYFNNARKVLGNRIKAFTKGDINTFYGIISPKEDEYWLVNSGTNLGAFQSKFNYKDASSYDLIYASCSVLYKRIDNYERVSMPMPGVGFGGLRFEKVKDILNEFFSKKDNLFIYTK